MLMDGPSAQCAGGPFFCRDPRCRDSDFDALQISIRVR